MQIARCGAKAERFPLRRRDMIEKTFSTGTYIRDICVSNSSWRLPNTFEMTQFIVASGVMCAVRRFIVYRPMPLSKTPIDA